MAITNHERVGRALELLRVGLAPYVERELKSAYKGKAQEQAEVLTDNAKDLLDKAITEWDVAGLLKLMIAGWELVFKKTLGPSERSLVFEIRDHRNKWAHQKTFTSDDADRALDSTQRLLTAISAAEADEVGKMKMELRRLIFDEQMRSEQRRTGTSTIESSATGQLKPWREVVSPHKDVASGRYQQAEFAADLWQVHIGEGSDEYRDPAEFFRRTYLTGSLKDMLRGAAERLNGKGGDPVMQLQTNFGGGKTHSMLALYHMFSGTAPKEMLGLEALMAEVGIDKLPKAKRVVLVGNKISPGNPSTKPDGTVVHTLWGELAWQLGGKKAYKRIQKDDERATSPGDVLRELMVEYGPCLILVDEWVAYARQLHDAADLPGGSFETHFTFAQALTESAKLAKNCLLVISLPASDTSGSPHTQADDVEVGGERGRAALERLRNAVGRVETSWRPANAEEGFEIVRRRLFEPLIQKEQFVARDTVSRAFFDLYSTQKQEFPPEAHESEYEKRMKAAYPIHPEVFDRLYGDWSTLVKFQRTRGVLRLMAAVIHCLWEKGDRNPMIMPANIPIDDSRVQFELTRYLSDNWVPVIEKDVDGANALPLRIDSDVPNLGRYAASRRVARTIYLGSAPTATAANKGIEDRRIKLGCVMPGEAPAIFGDALRRLSAAATYLYQDGSRYWYSTQPTVTKLADDRAEQLKRDPDAVVEEIEKRLRADLRKMGDFNRVQALPASGADVPDDMETRLVVLRPDHAYIKDADCPAEQVAKSILASRGNAPRLFQNTLVFLAVDSTRLQDMDEAVRRYMAWQSILVEKDTLDLSPHQVRQAETQKSAAEGAVVARLPEAYQWLLVPTQEKPQDPVTWQAFRLTGSDPLAVRVSKKLKNDELLVNSMAGTRLRMELDRVPLWRGDNVAIKQLAEDHAKYLYLQRMTDMDVLGNAIRDGINLGSWEQDSFAYADSYDEATGRYRGLRAGEHVGIAMSAPQGLLVKSSVARAQMDAEQQARSIPQPGTPAPGNLAPTPGKPGAPPSSPSSPAKPAQPRRYYGTVQLDASRPGRDAGRVAEEVIAHLTALMGSKVKVTLEISAEVPEGVPENVVRTVLENGTTLKFTSKGFEAE
jgi:predicted AAA+ superfamily ATPase